jgi:hypothetical protein
MQFIGGTRALVMNSIPLLQEDDQYSASIMDADESERTERKRKRERDRRSELTRAFDDLGAVLNDLDPVPAAQGGGGGSGGGGGGGGGKKGKKGDVDLTRLDKLHRTTALLRRMHRDMVALQQQIRTYEQQPAAAARQHSGTQRGHQQSERDDGEKVSLFLFFKLCIDLTSLFVFSLGCFGGSAGSYRHGSNADTATRPGTW